MTIYEEELALLVKNASRIVKAGFRNVMHRDMMDDLSSNYVHYGFLGNVLSSMKNCAQI